MKQCPICDAKCFDDAEICVGCMHRFGNEEKQFKEAIRRLKKLEKQGLHENVLMDFETQGLVNYSERAKLGNTPMGVLYWVTNDTAVSKEGKPFLEVIKDFENEYSALVYHATTESTEFGELLSLFYVSNYPEEWDDDYVMLNEGSTYAYVVNLSDPLMSEFGLIGFKVVMGGIVRTY